MVLLPIFHISITFWESLILNQQLWRCSPTWPLFSHYDRKSNGRGPRWYSSPASPWCPFKGGPHWPELDWSVGAFSCNFSLHSVSWPQLEFLQYRIFANQTWFLARLIWPAEISRTGLRAILLFICQGTRHQLARGRIIHRTEVWRNAI